MCTAIAFRGISELLYGIVQCYLLPMPGLNSLAYLFFEFQLANNLS